MCQWIQKIVTRSAVKNSPNFNQRDTLEMRIARNDGSLIAGKKWLHSSFRGRNISVPLLNI